MGKIIITGVGGQFGHIAAEKILEDVPANELIFTSHVPEALSKYKEKGVDVRTADFNDVDSLTDAFKGGEILLLISMPIVGKKRVQMHKNAIDSAKKAGVKKIVYTSIVGAGDEDNDALVVKDHNATEDYIKASGLKWNFARNSQYAEAMVEYALPNAFKTGKWTTNQGDGEMAYVSRKDCAAAAVALVRGKGEDNTIYYITGPELLTLEGITQIAKEVTGKSIEVINLTDEETFAMFDAMGVPRTTDNGMKGSPIPWCSDDMVSFGRVVREGKMAAFTENVEKLTGKKPVSMRELIAEAVTNGLY
jgi:NAD(P)H dehydrogenase (quinone)